jgi:hypothetical protein
MKKKIEILAPAKDLIQGIAAINAGALSFCTQDL